MKWYYKVLIGSGALLLLLIALNFGVNLWIKYQLPKIIDRENRSAYEITFKELEVSLWNNNIVASQVRIEPKKTADQPAEKKGIHAQVKSIRIDQFKVWDLLFSDKIKAKSLRIDQPQVVLYKQNDKAINRYKSIQQMVVLPFDQIISVPNIFLHGGDVTIIYAPKKQVVLSLKNIDFQLDGLVISESIVNEKIPFRFRSYSLKCDQAYYRANQFYRLQASNISASEASLSLSKFKMIPTLSRSDFVASLTKEKDLYTLLCESVAVSKMHWGFMGDDFFFHSNKVLLDQVAANIYRSKSPADDMKKKYLYNKLLRELKFDLKVDTLQVRHSMVEYEEEKSEEIGPGKLSFSRFNLVANNIKSGFKKQKLDNVRIKIDCRFMKASPLSVDWKFNVLDQSDGFNIRGKLTNFDAEAMAPFTKPYMNITTEGVMDEVNFNFTGNDRRDSGELAVEYDDLKFTIYQKDDRKKKNKLLTFVARIFVKKDTKERLKAAHVEVERIPEKSFYNFLWRSVAEGLKKILV